MAKSKKKSKQAKKAKGKSQAANPARAPAKKTLSASDRRKAELEAATKKKAKTKKLAASAAEDEDESDEDAIETEVDDEGEEPLEANDDEDDEESLEADDDDDDDEESLEADDDEDEDDEESVEASDDDEDDEEALEAAESAEAAETGGSAAKKSDELSTHTPLILGAAAAREAAGDDDDEEEDAGSTAATVEDDHDPLAEFASYDSLDDEYPEDELEGATFGQGSELDADDEAALVSPKDRRLAEMRLEARIEAIIFAAQKPLKTAEIVEILADATLTEGHVQDSINQLVTFYADRHGGFRLHYLKRLGYQFQTTESAGVIMERMFASRPRPISRAALETLSIISYRQPATRAEVEFIRGVDAGSIFKTLLERDLIKCTGRKEIVGRPMLFGTTDNFLTVFNLSSIKDLPPLESFQPSREIMQGALEKIEGGEDGILTDVEDYIADNTRGEYEEGDLDTEGEDADLALDADAEAALTARSLTGATSKPGDAEEPATDATDAEATTPAAESSGASAASDEPLAGSDDDHGTDADTEVALPDGDSKSEGGGDLDR